MSLIIDIEAESDEDSGFDESDASDDNRDNENDDNDYNIIINVKELKELITNNFICLHCMKNNRKVTKVDVSIKTYGIAVDLVCTC